MEESGQLPVQKARRARRVLGVGCLAVLVATCSGVAALGYALKDGPVTMSLPGNAALQIGSDDFVLSNDSFQNGTTYFADLKGTDARNILELHVLSDTHSLELVLQHATKTEQSENHLLTVPAP